MSFRSISVAFAVVSVFLARTAQADCTADKDCPAGKTCKQGQCADALDLAPGTTVAPAAAPAAAPAPAAPALTACLKDADCKGDRICERGTCGDPRPSAVSTPAAAVAHGRTDEAVAPARGAGESMRLPTGVVFVPRFGFILSGSTDAAFERKVTTTTESKGWGTELADDVSSYVLGIDALYSVSPNWRLGLGTLLTPSTKFEKDGGKAKFGTDLSLVGIVEPVFPVGASTSLLLRGFGGMVMLFPGGDFKDSINESKDECESLEEAGGTCSVKDGPFPGWTFGAGGGVMFDAGAVRPRIDLIYQYYSIGGHDHDMRQYNDPPYGEPTLFKVSQKNSASGSRLMLTGGIEF